MGDRRLSALFPYKSACRAGEVFQLRRFTRQAAQPRRALWANPLEELAKQKYGTRVGARNIVSCAAFAVTVWGCSGESRIVTRGAAGTSAAGRDGDGPRGGAGPASEPPPAAVVDDMDHVNDGYPDLPPGGGFWWGLPDSVHLGNWFVVSPGHPTTDASIEEISPPRTESTRACHVAGSDFEPGVDLSAELDHPQHRAVDLSAYEGITFWVKLDSPSSKLTVAVSAGPSYFDAEASSAPLPSQTLTVKNEWQQVVLSFEAFGLTTSDIASIDFVAGVGGEPFDLWVDDLAFLCRGPC